jgi:hypothetical protein
VRRDSSGSAGPANTTRASGRRCGVLSLVVLVGSAWAGGSGFVDATAATAPIASKPPVLSPRLDAIASPTAADGDFTTQARSAGLPERGLGSLLRDEGGRLIVDVRLADHRIPSGSDLARIGASLLAVDDGAMLAAVAVPAGSLQALARMPEVRAVVEGLEPYRDGTGTSGDPAGDTDRFLTNAVCGTGVLTEGDAQLRADDARLTFGVDGAGVTVGILSDTFDRLGGAAADVASSELPGPGNPCGRTEPVDVQIDFVEGGSDEGRAMAQIVHDLAPGAHLSFATAAESELQFAERVTQLGEAGADVMTDDIAYLYEPMFQDGYIAAAINDNFTERDILHFTSAGNSNLVIGGRDVASYEAPSFRPASCPAGIPAAQTVCHDFAPGTGVDTGNGLTLESGGNLNVALGWSQPQFGVTTDLDLFLVNRSTNSVVADSIIDSVLTGRPNEYLSYQNTSGVTQQLDLVVGRFADTPTGTPRLKYVFMQSSGVTSVERDASAGGDIVGPTLIGHAAAELAVGVAAVPYDDPTTPEDFSSRGPGRTCWEPVAGNSPRPPLTPCRVVDVDLTATDGAANSFFGTLDDSTWRFYGTSAAAPHAAAVAALAIEHAPCATGPEILAALTSTAAAVGSAGVAAVGAGLIDAEAALGALDTSDTWPCVRDIPDVEIPAGRPSRPIPITVADEDDGADALVLTATSSDEAIVPDAGLALGGTGSDRTLTITPAAAVAGPTTITVTATDPGGLAASASFVATVVSGEPIVESVTPARVADTRPDGDTVDARFQGDGAIPSDTTYEVVIAGRGGIDSDATAAVLNLSTVDSAGNGFLTVHDCGTRPLASGINYAAGEVVNNEIITKLSPTGTICIYAKTTTHLVIDAVGWVPSTSSYAPLRPARLVDTRPGGATVDDQFSGVGLIPSGGLYEVTVAGRGGIDPDATAAVLNLSTVDSAGNGFLTVYDCGTRPLASGINYAAGRVVNNEIITKLSPTGTICIYAKTTTHLVIDAVGHL